MISVIDALDLLQTCEEDIEENCGLSLNIDDNECNIKTKTFVTKYDECGDLEPQLRCDCIQALSTEYEGVKKCRKNSTDVFKTSNEERNKCNLVFPACKSMLPVIVQAVLECKSLLSRNSQCACSQTDKTILDEVDYDVLNSLSTDSPGVIL